MKKLNLDERVKKYLGETHKNSTQELRNLPDGTWRSNNYSHILPCVFSDRNLLSGYREDIKNIIKSQRISLHNGFSHLNSSQAMCMNFFGPFVFDKSLRQVLALLIKDMFSSLELAKDDLQLKFEHQSDKDNNYKFANQKQFQKPTNFDFYVSNGKIKIYFEIKYCEKGYDSKKLSEEKYRQKYDSLYKGLASTAICKNSNTEEHFLNNYQLMRNMIHIDDNSYLVLIYPEQNLKVREQAEKAHDYLESNLKNHLHCITWENLHNKVCKFTKELKVSDNRFDQHMSEFQKKYLSINAV